jgi:DNA recombination protein RmuC
LAFIRQETKLDGLQQNLSQILTQHGEMKIQLVTDMHQLKANTQEEWTHQRSSFDKRLLEGMQSLQEGIQKTMQDVRAQINLTLNNHTDTLTKRVERLTDEMNLRLHEISSQVEKRLAAGFEKTTATFADVLKRLALIDQAQKKISELSHNVTALQEVLTDKRSRGAFGEVQLSALIRNVMPETSFATQHTLSNGKRVDCILLLPKPTGNIAIDAKFPLETYRKMTNSKENEAERRLLEQQFRQDIRKHIHDIKEKYILPGETADGAILFIPAEAIFADIHAHFPEIVEEAYQARVWMTSPTTLMAVLTTARAVLKDEDTRKEIHVIQEHLRYLAKDFMRFQQRIDNLARHIGQANEDVKDVHTSARKITSRFQQIERVELEREEERKVLEES